LLSTFRLMFTAFPFIIPRAVLKLTQYSRNTIVWGPNTTANHHFFDIKANHNYKIWVEKLKDMQPLLVSAWHKSKKQN